MKINNRYLGHLPKAMFNVIIAFAMITLSFIAYRNWLSSPTTDSVHTPPVTAPFTSNEDATERSIRLLEDWIKRDPDNFILYNKLAGYYLERLRQTGNIAYLDLTSRAARASLAIIPAQQNTGALAALAQVEFASHNFAKAGELATQLMKLDPGKSYPYAALGDALLELGDYDKAIAAFRQMERLGGGANTEGRLARFAVLRGETSLAQLHLKNALALTLNLPVPPPEIVAWYYWQLGETAFAIGDYETAERHYRSALTTFPGYFNALASLGRVRAARGDLSGAIEQYEHAVRRLPDPTFVAALGDLYKLAGREKEAAAQYALVEQIGHLNAVNGAVYNRQLALFYADHDLKAEEAYANAKREYAVRHDIYGADAVAWTALKAGKILEAQAAMKEALRLGTRDAKLFYHAGMIAHAEGNRASARDYLQHALSLNPQFDPLQVLIAKRALEN